MNGSTGGAAKLAAHIFDMTGRTDLVTLAWAKQMYDWVRTNLLSPENGLYWDKFLVPDGSIDETQWIYNQGIMIGASVLLHGRPRHRQPSLRRSGRLHRPR